jgi:hypothetical protein
MLNTKYFSLILRDSIIYTLRGMVLCIDKLRVNMDNANTIRIE